MFARFRPPRKGVGFSLIEVLLVVLIGGLIAAIVVPSL
jgi:prepilin-type N-terminal cleavage/methylation domain-containing protein